MQIEESIWKNEFIRQDFTFEGHSALIVFPRNADPQRPWVLKTEYFDAFQSLELELVRDGWHLAYIANSNRWGTDDDTDRKHRFSNYLVGEYGLNEKCIPIGMSCGGLQAIKIAAKYPEMVCGLYLDAPVINLLSCPFGFGVGSDIDENAKQEALSALGLTLSEMIAYRGHPLDMLEKLAEARIPAVLVWGDADRTVPFEENGLYVQNIYLQKDIPILLDLKPGCAHHPHGPSDLRKTIAFLARCVSQTMDRDCTSF